MHVFSNQEEHRRTFDEIAIQMSIFLTELMNINKVSQDWEVLPTISIFVKELWAWVQSLQRKNEDERSRWKNSSNICFLVSNILILLYY